MQVDTSLPLDARGMADAYFNICLQQQNVNKDNVHGSD